MDSGLDAEKRVHYYTMGAEQWQAADSWPPAQPNTQLYFAEGGSLTEMAPKATDGEDIYQADYDCRTGFHTRYDRLYIANVETYYDEWHGCDDHMLNYTGAPLAVDTEMSGHATVDLHFAASEKDACFFVYISDITPDGRSVYVTEGVFRALHRAPGENPPTIPATGPVHSFNKADAQHLVPGTPAEVAFELLPTSYLFKAGHRIRVSIASADSDHFTRIPDGRPPRLQFFRHAGRASAVCLPIVS